MSEKKRTEDWILFENPEGEKRIGSPAYIKGILGIDKLEGKIWNLKNENYILKQRLIRLEAPYRQKEVISLLSKTEKPHNFTWLKNRIPNLGIADMEPLVKEGSVLVEDKAGHRMFTLDTSDKRKKEES